MILRIYLILTILILSCKISIAEDIPIIVITASKKPQSLSTVGTSVTILDEKFFNEKKIICIDKKTIISHKSK